MNKTKIDWADMSWNPVTGCLHGCDYCYARKIAERFGGGGYGRQMGMFIAEFKADAFKPPYDLIAQHLAKTKDGWYRDAPYPFGFEPTLHRYRLIEPMQIKKPQNIFVCSMADLFGGWVPQEWQQEVLQACLNAPQHRYLFLTKAPNHVCQWPRYQGDKEYLEYDHDNKGAKRDNVWMGVSFTGLKEDIPHIEEYYGKPWDDRAWYLNRLCVHFCGHKFMSIEPIHCDVTELHKDYIDGFSKKPDKEYWFQDVARKYEWIIVGAETGNRKEKIVPERSWIEHLATFCKNAGIPIFMKSSLRDLMGEDFIQQFPWKTV